MVGRAKLQSAHDRVEELIAQRAYERAAQEAVKALRRFPKDARLDVYLATCLLAQDPERAKAAIESAVSHGSDDVGILLEATQLMMSLDAELGRQYGAAAERLVSTEKEDIAMLAYLKGRYAQFDDEPESAIEWFREVVAMDSHHPLYAEHLVAALSDEGCIAEARAVSVRAIETAFDPSRLQRQRETLGFD